MTVAIVVPTVQGREQDLKRCVEAYHDTAPAAKVYIEYDHPSCGHAWIKGAQRAERDGFDYLHFTADDLEPHPGWLETAIATVDAGYIPAPLVYHPDGSLQSAGIAGFSMNRATTADWAFIEGTTVPFLTREMWEAVGMVPIHYCSDIWVSEMGRRHGWQTVIRQGMRFTHYTAMPGRDEGRSGADTAAYLQFVRDAA